MLDDVAGKVLVRYTQCVGLPHVADLMNKLPHQLGEGGLLSYLLDARVQNLREGVFVKVNAGMNHPSDLSGLAPVEHGFVKNGLAELFFSQICDLANSPAFLNEDRYIEEGF